MAKKISLESLSMLVEKIGEKADENFFSLMGAVAELRGRTINLEDTQEEILEKLEPLSRAYDKDAETVIDHEKRIVRLEKNASVRG